MGDFVLVGIIFLLLVVFREQLFAALVGGRNGGFIVAPLDDCYFTVRAWQVYGQTVFFGVAFRGDFEGKYSRRAAPKSPLVLRAGQTTPCGIVVFRYRFGVHCHKGSAQGRYGQCARRLQCHEANQGRKEGTGCAGFLSGCVHRPYVYAASNPV